MANWNAGGLGNLKPQQEPQQEWRGLQRLPVHFIQHLTKALAKDIVPEVIDKTQKLGFDLDTPAFKNIMDRILRKIIPIDLGRTATGKGTGEIDRLFEPEKTAFSASKYAHDPAGHVRHSEKRQPGFEFSALPLEKRDLGKKIPSELEYLTKTGEAPSGFTLFSKPATQPTTFHPDLFRTLRDLPDQGMKRLWCSFNLGKHPSFEQTGAKLGADAKFPSILNKVIEDTQIKNLDFFGTTKPTPEINALTRYNKHMLENTPEYQDFLKTLKKASKFKKLPDTLAARAVIGNLAKNNPNFHAAQITTDPKTDDAVKKLLKVLKNKGPKKALKNLLGN